MLNATLAHDTKHMNTNET